MASLILDAGAAFALVRGDRRARARAALAVEAGYRVAMPTPVLAQVHRGGRNHALLDRALAGVIFVPTSEAIARHAGALLAKTGMSDAIDAIVAAEALASVPALILTSDAGDLAALIRDEPGANRVLVLTV